MSKQSKHRLTWGELAELYQRHTGASAKIRSFDEVFKWAEAQPFIKKNRDGSLSIIKEN